MDITVMAIVVVSIIAVAFFRTKAALIISHFISGLFVLYGLVTIVANIIEPNHLSGLAYIVGGVFILFGLGLFMLSRKLYKNKLKRMNSES